MSGDQSTMTPVQLTTPGPVKVHLLKGEILDIGKGKFRVASIGRKIMLEPMPKTHVVAEDPREETKALSERIFAMNLEHKRVITILMAIIAKQGGKIAVTEEEIEAVGMDDTLRMKPDAEKKGVVLETFKEPKE